MKKRLFLFLLPFICSPAFAGALVDTPNVGSTFSSSSTTSYTTPSYTVASGDNFLLVIEWAFTAGSKVAATSVSCNAQSLTIEGTATAGASNGWILSAWYLANPTVGSGTCTVTYPVNIGSNAAFVFIPMKGVNTSSPFGTLVTTNNGTGTPISATATGGSANDIYIGGGYINGTGAPTQTNANGTNIAAVSSGNLSVDSIPGADTGNFTWTATGTPSTSEALALPVLGASGGPPKSQFFFGSIMPGDKGLLASISSRGARSAGR